MKAVLDTMLWDQPQRRRTPLSPNGSQYEIERLSIDELVPFDELSPQVSCRATPLTFYGR